MDELLAELNVVCEGEQLTADRIGQPIIFHPLKSNLDVISTSFAQKIIEFNKNPLSTLLGRELTELWDKFFEIKSRYLKNILQSQYIPEAQIVYAKYLCSGSETQIPYQPTIGLELFKRYCQSSHSKLAQFAQKTFDDVFVEIDLGEPVQNPKIDIAKKGNKNRK